MSTQPIIDKIIADAESQAQAIRSEAEQEVKKILTAADTESKDIQTQAEIQAEKSATQRAAVEVSVARQQTKQNLQQVKRDAIEAVFADSFTALASLSGDEYVAFYQSRVASLVPELTAVVRVEAPASKISETEQLLAAVDLAVVAVQPVESIDGGLIIHTDAHVFDVSLNRIFRDAKPEAELAVAHTLFVAS